MKKGLFIIKVGTTFPNTRREFGDFDAWTIKGLGGGGNICVIDAEHGETIPAADECAGAVVTGSHDYVTDNLAWSVRVAKWIPALVEREIPFLGICYGHQLLAHALGGKVGFHPEGAEVGTVDVMLLPECADDLLFGNMPKTFPVHVTHSQTVVILPKGAVRLARNPYEPNHAFRIGRCAWGVQFHPEYNAGIMRSYIKNENEDLLREGIDILPILASVKETPVAASILTRFFDITKKAYPL